MKNASNSDYFVENFENDHRQLQTVILNNNSAGHHARLGFVCLTPNYVSWSQNPEAECISKMKSPYKYLVFLYLLSVMKTYNFNPLDVPEIYGVLSGSDMVYSPDIIIAASSLWIPEESNINEAPDINSSFESFWQNGIPYLINLNSIRNEADNSHHNLTVELLRTKLLNSLNHILGKISSNNDIFIQICDTKYDYRRIEHILQSIIDAS